MSVNPFPISRDPPEGGTLVAQTGWNRVGIYQGFPISRDPPEGGTRENAPEVAWEILRFQFLGIPPKGEHRYTYKLPGEKPVSNF